MVVLNPETHKLTHNEPLTMFFLDFESLIPGGYQHRLSFQPLDGEMPANSFSSETEVLLCQP